MYSPLYDTDWSQIFSTRLAQAEQELRDLSFSTLEEYQAAVYQRLNGIFTLGNKMTPLSFSVAGSPATIGDIQENIQTLLRDADVVTAQLEEVESSAARLLNLFAATQNSLRQQVREMIYQPTNKEYIEAFVKSSNLLSNNASLDFGAGVVTLPLISETEVLPSSYRIGPLSSGQVDSGSSLDLLLDKRADTVFSWSGKNLELVFDFPNPGVINRIKIELDEYEGMTLDEVTSTPDGSLRENILGELDPRFKQLDASSGKFTGDCTLDFTPKQASQIRIVISDHAGIERVGLRSITFYRRQYQSKVSVQSVPIQFPACTAAFTSKESSLEQYTSITHLISEDGAHYHVIRPGEDVILPGTFYYRALLERIEETFEKESSPLIASSDLKDTSLYKVSGTSTVNLGANIVERSISFANVSGQVALKDIPLPGTLTVYIGQMLATPAVCVISGNQLNFQYEVEGVVVKYQTSTLGAAGLKSRKDFYSPHLYEVRFERLS